MMSRASRNLRNAFKREFRNAGLSWTNRSLYSGYITQEAYSRLLEAINLLVINHGHDADRIVFKVRYDDIDWLTLIDTGRS